MRLSHDIYPDICKYINNNNPEYLKLAFDPKLTTEEIYMILNPDSEEAYLKTHPFAVQIDDAITEEETRSSNTKKKYIAEMESKESTLSAALIVVTSLIFIPVLIFAIAMLVDEDWTSFVISMLVVGIFYLICVPKWLYYKRESAEQKHMPQNYVDQNKAMFVSLLGGKDIHTLLALPSHVMYNYNLRKDLVYYSVPKPFYAYQKKIIRIVEEYGLTGIVHMNTEPTISQILSSYPPPVQNQLSYPWVANMLADIQEEYDKLKIERVSKKAVKSAEIIQQIRKEKRILKTELSLVKNQLRVYESLFPWLEEFKELDISDAVKYATDTAYDEDYDEVLRKYLSPEEYSKLSLTEKNQLALDRYKARQKTDWEVGIEYERYIGYLYEKDGYRVEYTGALNGVHDMGRDLIAKKGKTTYIIQCKRWNQEKTIHEKHIFQTYGTTVLERIMNPSERYKAVFYTTTELSPLATQCAQELMVTVHQNFPYDNDYPMIKCNIGKDENNQTVWIYHLPFDQQYNRVIIDYSKGERYVRTVKEAEALGFRRAYRHHYNAE